VRHGKRYTQLTEAGEQILAAAERVLDETAALRKISEQFAAGHSGTLSIAATHTQARYVLPTVLAAFRIEFPAMQFKLLQGNPQQVAEFVVHGDATFGLATETLDEHPSLDTRPAYAWRHCLIVPGNRFEYLEALAARDAVAVGELDPDGFRPGALDVLAQHVIGLHRQKCARTNMERQRRRFDARCVHRVHQFWRKMQRCSWRRHRAILLREHRLIILRIAFIGRPLASYIGRQGHGPCALQQDFDRRIPFEKQIEAAIIMAFFGYGDDAFAKIDGIAGVQAFGVADKGLPTA
jgi:hypothetical protein